MAIQTGKRNFLDREVDDLLHELRTEDPPKLLTVDRLEILLRALRAGQPVQEQLRNGLAMLLVETLNPHVWGLAFEKLLTPAVERLAKADIPASEVHDYIRRAIRFGPRLQKQQDVVDIVYVPKSSRSRLRRNGKHVPSVQQFADNADKSPGFGSRVLRGEALIEDKREPFERPDYADERSALVEYAKTDFQRKVAWRMLWGETDEHIAREMGITPRLVKRTETILRKRAGYTYSRDEVIDENDDASKVDRSRSL